VNSGGRESLESTRGACNRPRSMALCRASRSAARLNCHIPNEKQHAATAPSSTNANTLRKLVCAGLMSAIISAPPETRMRILVLLAFLGIVASLVSAGIYLMKDRGQTNRMVNALTVRIGLSIVLFLFVLLAGRLGWLQATGIPIG